MRRAFTLIELLVVISIIAVLLALLMPALDKSIYQAELAVCAANVRSLGTGAQVYAVAERRFYPYRKAISQAQDMAKTVAYIGIYNDRPTLAPYLNLKALVCPLSASVDIPGSKPDTFIYASYSLWFGFGWAGEANWMRRMGDRFSFNEQGDSYRFDFLAGDHLRHQAQQHITTAHPDKAGILNNEVYQDRRYGDVVWQNISADYTFTRWQGFNDRPMLDLHYGHDDGSVERIEGIINDDDRFVPVPSFSSKGSYGSSYTVHDGWWDSLPK